VKEESDIEPCWLHKPSAKRKKPRNAKSNELGRKLIEHLERYPATPKELSDQTGINHETVRSNLRGRLMDLGLLRQLDDGKYVAKWISDEEIRVKVAYRDLGEKLMRRPGPEELAIYLKESPPKTKELLLKYIPRYHEPTDEVICSAGEILARTIALGSLEFPSKRTFYVKGIERLLVDGLDQNAFNKIFAGSSQTEIQAAHDYLMKFPEMRVKMSHEDKNKFRHYTAKWSYDALNYLDVYCPKDQTAECALPRRLKASCDRYYNLRLLADGEKRQYAMSELQEMARYFVPTPSVIEDLLQWLTTSDKKGDILSIVKMFCHNGLEVDEIRDEQKAKLCDIVSRLAFEASLSNEGGSQEYDAGWNAFEIIKILDKNRERTGDKAMEFVCSILEKGYGTGNYLFEVSKWLAGNPNIRLMLEKRAEDILIKSNDKKVADGCEVLLKKINYAWDHQLTESGSRDWGAFLEINDNKGLLHPLRK